MRILAAVSIAGAAGLAGAGTPTANAQTCSDVEVVFARGTTEPAGVGWLGTAFVNNVRSKIGSRSLATYAVNYPASWDLYTSVRAGSSDALAHIHSTVANCPNTRIILGGYSQGAGVIDELAIAAPVGVFTPMPIPSGDEPHIAAIAVFGNPMRTMNNGGPLDQKSPVYGSRTIDQCADRDKYCAGGTDDSGHFAYLQNGMVDQAGTFVTGRL
ncbi:Cutinase [Mycolicibacterium chubuense NBB4]|uniref:Cutinase n=1 Tax=Mycolicibacterium chubuense (strain NBB4) TaxID=710421 RepID=I4BL04_MYCCN|nr:cutinase family protein [Mycolicibacterium chubuense]AFM17961.1 Cutinase [Mycolicibacterium chubuense NBB4]